MSEHPFAVEASSGVLRPDDEEDVVRFGHRWTDEGVVVRTEFTGGHLLNLAIAGCVLNDTHREAQRIGVGIDGVRVAAWGDFDRETWQSTGVTYTVDVSSSATPDEITRLLEIVDSVAEIPKALRAEATVVRFGDDIPG